MFNLAKYMGFYDDGSGVYTLGDEYRDSKKTTLSSYGLSPRKKGSSGGIGRRRIGKQLSNDD